jgi:hypothetical protein
MKLLMHQGVYKANDGDNEEKTSRNRPVFFIVGKANGKKGKNEYDSPPVTLKEARRLPRAAVLRERWQRKAHTQHEQET